MLTNNSKTVFDSTASTYDRDRFLLIPNAEDFYRWAVNLVPPDAATILDLGAGSGLLTVFLRARFPEAHIHLVDFSAPMLDLARARFAGDPHISFHQADYVTDPIPQAICAAVSSLSIHHLDDPDKQTVFRRVHEALKPNGVFVNADQTSGPTPALEQRYQAIWLQQIRQAGATEQQITDSLYRRKEDRCVPVARQVAWMREAGFSDADCWFKDNSFAVFAGTKL